jgi:arsenate reductase (thioredoxin)
MKEILFICTHNSARSQIAEAITNALHGDKYRAYSAGTEPTSINPHVIKALSEIGIDASKQKSKSINKFQGKTFEYVVTVCDHAKETCPFFPGKTVLHKSFADPSKFQGTEKQILQQIRQVRNEIRKWIEETFSQESS